MTDKIDGVLRRMSMGFLSSLCFLVIIFLGWVDFLTGFEASFSIFYLLPISVSAWYNSSRVCYVYSLLAAGVWDFSNVLAGEVLSHPLLHAWNGCVRAGFFVTTSMLLQRLRGLLDREQTNSRLDYQTGLMNSRAFHEALRAEHSRAVRKARFFSLAFIDLDHFKKVNDDLGHAEGDRVLVEVARTLEANLRESDTIARLGGDEFALILPECSADDARQVASKLLTCLRELSSREGWPVTASIGFVVHPDPHLSDNMSELLKSADHLMYQVKEQGRDGFLIESTSRPPT